MGNLKALWLDTNIGGGGLGGGRGRGVECMRLGADLGVLKE